jgi:hypothetical protein
MSPEHDDPRIHTERIKAMLDDVVEHVRADVVRVDDPRARALFEVTAEVLTGLKVSYQHYEEGSEPAWR